MTPPPERRHPTLLRVGHNCSAIAHAKRVKFLIDGKAYFSAVHDALQQARQQILIVGWDFDTRIRLQAGDDCPPFGAQLTTLIRERPELQIYVLTWDYAPIFLLEREPGLRWKMKLGSPSRLTFEMDDNHPLGGSQHEKLVVVDDSIAFCGGLDLCDVRWDTPEHRIDDPHRTDVHGRSYRPHHDASIMVGGQIAAALGRFVRERWSATVGRSVDPPLVGGKRASWPADQVPDLLDVSVGVLRTIPERSPDGPRRELERFWLDAIASARDFIYIETPYFTSGRLADALARRLRDPSGPEVLIVTAENGNGWIERHTMTVLRDRRIRQLKEADPGGRFACKVPVVPDEAGGTRAINVHSKICIVDDSVVRVGSGNMTNRSMGLDRECDVVLEETGDGRITERVRRLRTELIAEHLGCEPSRVRHEHERLGSLLRAVQACNTSERRLVNYEAPTSPMVDRLLPGEELVDPSRALDPSEIGSLMISDEKRRTYWRYIGMGWWATLILVAVLANAMDWISYPDLAAALAQFGSSGILPGLAVIATFVLSGLFLVPVTLMIINAGLLFGPWLGSFYALTGAFVSAAVYWWIGRRLGRHSLDRLAGPRLRNALRAVARRGVVAVAAIRLVPIAPHVVVGLLAGAARIAFRDYMIGTIVAMAPGAVLLVVLGDQINAGLTEASWTSLLPIIGAAIGIMAVAVLMQRLVGRGEAALARAEQETAPSGAQG